jgi:hypothetical protein
MTFTIGWWVLPTIITVALFAWALLTPMHRGGDYSFDLLPIFRFGGAVIGSLAVWLVYFIALWATA